MNLLYASYGHNQLAGLLLFGIPLVIGEGSLIPSWCKKTLLVLLLSGITFSFARGAWILLTAYFLFLLVTKRMIGKFNMSMIVVFIGAVAGLLVTMFLLSPRFAHVPPIMNNNWLYKQTIKPSVYENRVQYWLQALRAIQERPMFGSGPGTFYLQSKRLQDAPVSYSWFAHSFVLEQLVEVGLVGAVLWGILFVVQGRLLIRSRDHALLAGVILTFLYSLFEYNLNFLVIWLLFWAALGWLLGVVVKFGDQRIGGRPWGIYLCFFVVGIYCVSSISSVSFLKRAEPAFLLAPYNTDSALRLLDEKVKDGREPTSLEMILLSFFHKNNPEVMYELARISPVPVAISVYEKALMYDPQNTQYTSGFIERLLEENNKVAIGMVIERIGESVLPEKSRPAARQIPFTSPAIRALYTPSLFKDVGDTGSRSEYLAKIYYFLGLSLIDKRPEQTRVLWTLARDSAPEWGYFPAELASLYVYAFNDPAEAKRVLLDCQKDPYSKELCCVTLEYFSDMPVVGTYKSDIFQIR